VGAAPAVAFRSFFDLTYGPATSYLRRRLRGDGSYEDVASDAYAVAWRRWDDRPADPGEWLPWMYGICRNVLRNHDRSQARRLRLVQRIGAQPAPGEAADRDIDVELHLALGRLAELDREVLRLTHWEHLSHPEIARVLDCSTNAVAVRSHRARRRLAALLAAPRDRSPARPDMDASTTPLPATLEDHA
jgi:RNA polymerase sigma-70 factor (ECF subfamily)